jgi:hypothetical protein
MQEINSLWNVPLRPDTMKPRSTFPGVDLAFSLSHNVLTDAPTRSSPSAPGAAPGSVSRSLGHHTSGSAFQSSPTRMYGTPTTSGKSRWPSASSAPNRCSVPWTGLTWRISTGSSPAARAGRGIVDVTQTEFSTSGTAAWRLASPSSTNNGADAPRRPAAGCSTDERGTSCQCRASFKSTLPLW